MEVKAKLNRIRMSPKKVRLVLDVIRGMDIEEAQHQLQFLSKTATEPVLKLLNSAAANAENNFKLDKNNLFIKSITANDGPTLKRYRPRAYGRTTKIQKRSSIIEVTLAEKKESRKKGQSRKEESKKSKPAKDEKKDLKIVKSEEIKKEIPDKKKISIPTAEDKKKPMRRLKKIKDKLIHRTGEK